MSSHFVWQHYGKVTRVMTSQNTSKQVTDDFIMTSQRNDTLFTQSVHAFSRKKRKWLKFALHFSIGNLDLVYWLSKVELWYLNKIKWLEGHFFWQILPFHAKGAQYFHYPQILVKVYMGGPEYNWKRSNISTLHCCPPSWYMAAMLIFLCG